MFQIDTLTAARDLPAPGAPGTPGYFQSGNPLTDTLATVVSADWFNAVQEELVNVVEGGGLIPDKMDRTQVLLAIQNIAFNFSSGALLPIYPMVETIDSNLAVVAATGTVSVAAGQSFIWRGSRRFDTTDYLEADRTFAIVANTTYHLRWTQVDGFALEDVAGAGYNPAALPESDAAFDSSYDDMLVARVVTDGANIPTITSLRNEPIMRARMSGSTDATIQSATRIWSLDWARTPNWTRSWARAVGDDTRHVEQVLTISGVTRYAIHHEAWYRHHLDSSSANSSGLGVLTYDLTAEA